MGDSETIVAQAPVSDGVQYPSIVYTSGGFPVQDVSTLPCVSGVTASCASGRDTDVHVVIDEPVSNDENARENDSNPAQAEDFLEAKFVKKDSIVIVASSKRAASVDSEVLDTSQAAFYDDLNANVRETSYYSSLENGNATEISGLSSAEQQLDDNTALSPEEDRLWSIVRANSLDFSAWTSLIEETEKMAEDNILRIRRVYDAFLAEFPLCYGYWKKYADHEARLGFIDKVVEVYERAVQGVTYSVDIWLHYCIFTINTYGDPETIRRLFERGLAYVGTDYLSYPLWDKFIEYEYSQQEWSRLALIYTQIIEHPIQQLDRYFNSFKELASSRPLSDLRTTEEGASMGRVTQDDVNDRDYVQQSSEPASDGSTEAEELEKYVAIREEMYKKAKEFDSKIIGFETAIRRPYFHVRPLNVIELENWHNYLDFMEREGDFNKVVKLYERCLIACANYPEYWIRYVMCMDASGSMDLANNALARATQVFVKRQPDIHIFAAHFRELRGDVDGARAAYHLVHAEISPGLLEAIIKHANMERRLGKIEDAFLIYEQAIAVEKGKEHSLALPMLVAQYSRFLYLGCGNAEKARDVLVEAVDNVQLCKPLLEALIHLESVLPPPKRIDFLDSLVEKFVVGNVEGGSSFGNADKEEISCIFLELVDLFGDLNSIKRAEDRHTRYFSHHRSTSELKKRHADDYLASEKAKLAKTYSPAQALMGAYPAVQNQWGAYNLQAQAWPQAQAGQAQVWNPGYAQVAAVAAYGSYTQPQVPSASAQQTSTAYVTYPPAAYPAHAYPPQTYAAAPVAGQQPVQHQQTYYAGYY